MTGPNGSRPAWGLWVLLLLWAAAFAYSLWIFQATVPVGDGVVRGWNRVSGFFGWQLLAAVIALAVLGIGRRQPAGTPLRRISMLPAALSALVVVTVLLVATARFA